MNNKSSKSTSGIILYAIFGTFSFILFLNKEMIQAINVTKIIYATLISPVCMYANILGNLYITEISIIPPLQISGTEFRLLLLLWDDLGISISYLFSTYTI